MLTRVCIVLGLCAVCITGMSVYALSKGHDGLMLSGAIAAVGVIAGYSVGKSFPVHKNP